MHLTYLKPRLDDSFDRAAGQQLRNMLAIYDQLSFRDKSLLENVAILQGVESNAGPENPTTPTCGST